MRLFWIPLALNLFTASTLVASSADKVLEAVSAAEAHRLNYTYLYFENGVPTPLQHRRPQSEANVFARQNPDLVVQTGYYSFALDCDDMELKGYDALKGSDYLSALSEDVETFTPADLQLSLVARGKRYVCKSGVVQTPKDQLVRLIQSNRFVQRFDHTGLVFEAEDGSVLKEWGRLEVTAWAEHLVLKLDASAIRGVSEVALEVVSPKGRSYRSSGRKGTAMLVLQPHLDREIERMEWGNGYVKGAWESRSGVRLDVNPDYDEHALKVTIPADPVSYPRDRRRVDVYELEVCNPGEAAASVPLVFDQPKPRAITGTVMILCDESGRPTGIPVQVSKNWHGPSTDLVHRGSWLRGYTLLPLEAGERKRLMLKVVYGYWGDVAAISHSQLCLIGWGKNWKWDESALGAWGESFTYDPTLHAGAAFMDDVRPAFTTSYQKKGHHGWTENSGGGDFLVYRDSADTYRWLKRLKTAYLRTGPNMTEALYSGVTDDDKIRVTYSSRAVRTNDYHRRFHGFRYEFLEDVTEPERLVFHQMAAEYYELTEFDTFWVGDSEGMVLEGAATPGGDVYRGDPIPFNDRWLTIKDERSNKRPSRANRGLLAMEFSLNGETLPVFLHGYGRDWGGAGRMVFDLSSRSVSRSYRKGDLVEGMLEFVMTPKRSVDYWGEDEELRGRLERIGGDDWKLVYDEFRYNQKIAVAARVGEVLQNYPLEVVADRESGGVLADITFTSGGIGHVPVVLKEVNANSKLQVQVWSGSSWRVLDDGYYQVDLNWEGLEDVVFNLYRPSGELGESWRFRIVFEGIKH